MQELGWDEDTDDDLRADIEDAIDGEMLDEDADDVIDVVVLWWRDGDGDLVDALMDAIGPLAEDGYIWVLAEDRPPPDMSTRASRQAAHRRSDQTSAISLGDWSAARLVQPKARAGKKA